MSIYYQDDHVTLYHGAALEVAAWLQSDVLVTDPPYGIDYTGFGGLKGDPSRDRGRHKIVGDNSPAVRNAALNLWGSKPALVFGKWTIPYPQGTLQRIIWDKRPCGYMGNLNIPWATVEEEIYVLGEWPPLKPGGRLREGGTPARHPNIINVPTLNSQAANRPEHPTPKPLELMEQLIERTPQGTIADPFAGSGSTLVAARNLGRRAIGVELEEKYCEIIANRLSQGAFDFA